MTSYVDAPPLGPTYYYQVSAVTTVGESARSGERSATPDATSPTTPANPDSPVAGTTQLPLYWSASTDNVRVTAYRIYRNGNLVATVPTTHYIDSGLAPGTNYGYQVRAVDAAGNQSLPSSSVSAATVSVASGATTGVLAGVVYDQSGAPLRHASVSTVLPSGGVRSDTTSPTGVWKLTSLPAGTYTITITNAGSPTRTISLTAVAGYTVLGDVTL